MRMNGGIEIEIFFFFLNICFRQATQQMEERLKLFIEEHEASSLVGMPGEGSGHSSPYADLPADAIAIVRFVQHQVVELARDCLQKSHQQLVTSRYFYEMSDNLERLVSEAKDKSPDAVVPLGRMVRKLLLVISRPARLLECLEFDPEEFYHMLEEAEGQVSSFASLDTFSEIPQKNP